MSQILMSTFGTLGNAVPFFALGEGLSDRGHDVILFANVEHIEKCKRFNIQGNPIDTWDEYQDFLNDGHLLNAPQTIPVVFRNHYFPKVIREYELLRQRVRPADTVIITSDTPGIAPRLLSARYNLPILSVLTYPNQIEAMPLLDELVGTILKEDLNMFRSLVGLPAASDLLQWWHTVESYLATWPDWFHSPVPGPQNLKTIGFLYCNEPDNVSIDSLSKFLAAGEKPVLVSGGSGLFAGHDFFDLLLESLRSIGERVLVVAKRLLPKQPREGDNNLLWCPQVPSMMQLMQEVKLVAHHGGMGIIGQALAMGVPQLILANGGDRPTNARLVEELGVGLYLPVDRWQLPNIARSIQHLTNNQGVQARCALFRERLASEGSLDTVCELVERIAVRTSVAHSCMAQSRDAIGVHLTQEKESSKVSRPLQSLSKERRELLERLLAQRKGGST